MGGMRIATKGGWTPLLVTKPARLHCGYNCNYATSRPSGCALLTVEFKYVEAFLQCVAYYL
jgi:hypothetical protein